MSQAQIFVEGGGHSNELRTLCREGFCKLLEKSGFTGRAPRIVACGSRNAASDAFQTAHKQGNLAYVALLMDSEDPVSDVEQTWQHLKQRDQWERPAGVKDDQVLLMTNCMETWIVADQTSLSNIYKYCLQTSSLPSTVGIENRHRHAVQEALANATRNCNNAYSKNKRSFEALANTNPAFLQAQLPAFERMVRILNEKL